MNPGPRRSPDDEAPDDVLAAAAKRGDRDAFARLVGRHGRAVWRVAWALVRNDADADDLAQETFLRAWSAFATFETGRPLRPWLARICTNTAYSLFRARRRRPETALEPLLEAGRQWGTEDDPAAHAERAERDARLAACLAAMSEEHRAVLALRAVRDLSYDEIAAALGVPPGTVMSRLARARAELRRRMDEGEGGAP